MLRTKIVCTLGPATSSPQVIEQMVRSGLDVARINMSHGTHDENRHLIESVREAAYRVCRPLAVLVDLQGPRIRVGRLQRPAMLEDGKEIVFAPEDEVRSGELPTTYDDLAADISVGEVVLLDDGLLELECVARSGRRVSMRVVRGGQLSSGKGINLPGANIRAPSLTEKDLEDLDFALENQVEYVALSFVRTGADVATLKERVGKRALVVAKIEMAQALGHVEDILSEADAVMVARGDLGVELPFEQVPLWQKRIIQRANFYGRPVITATQMLDSMIDQPRPTRAEASDVANAILDGTDAVMLSGETAVGQYPLEAIDALVRIAREIEGSGVLEAGPHYALGGGEQIRSGASPREHAVAFATVASARKLRAPAIIVITLSGFSVRLVSSYRPHVPIYGVCTEKRTYDQLAAVWGVRPVLATGVEISYEALTEFGKRVVLETGGGRAGESVIVTSGIPFHKSGSTNTMRIEPL